MLCCSTLARTLERTKRARERPRIVASLRKSCELGYEADCALADAGGTGVELSDRDSPTVAAAPVSQVERFEPKGDAPLFGAGDGFEAGDGAASDPGVRRLLASGPPGPELETACEQGDVEACNDLATYWRNPTYSARHMDDDAPPAPKPDPAKAERFARIGCDLGNLGLCYLEGQVRVDRHKGRR